MKFLVRILSGSSFEIEVDLTDTLIVVKQKIEKSQGIPVSKQTLNGVVILRDDLNVQQCQIVHDSLLQLDVSSHDNPNHNGAGEQMPQTEPSPPWLSVEEYFEGQDWPLTAEEIKEIYSYRSETTQEISKIQDSLVSSNKNQMLHHQTEQYPASNSVKETVNIQDSYVKVKWNKKNNNKNSSQMPPTKQSPQSNSIKEITKIQDWPVTVRSNSRVVPRHVTQQTRKIRDSQLTFGSSNKNQVLHQTKQSPAYSYVRKKKIKIFVLPSSDECKAGKNEIEVDVSLTDHLKILRNELAESQRRGHLNLPQEGYYFATMQKVLDEDESFEWNGFTSPIDIVWMVSRRVTKARGSQLTVLWIKTKKMSLRHFVYDTFSNKKGYVNFMRLEGLTLY